MTELWIALGEGPAFEDYTTGLRAVRPTGGE